MMITDWVFFIFTCWSRRCNYDPLYTPFVTLNIILCREASTIYSEQQPQRMKLTFHNFKYQWIITMSVPMNSLRTIFYYRQTVNVKSCWSCLDFGESCMKLTAQESDCFISSKVRTEPCNITEVTTFIVTQLNCPEPDIVTITARVGVNIAEGKIIHYKTQNLRSLLLYCLAVLCWKLPYLTQKSILLEL